MLEDTELSFGVDADSDTPLNSLLGAASLSTDLSTLHRCPRALAILQAAVDAHVRTTQALCGDLRYRNTTGTAAVQRVAHSPSPANFSLHVYTWFTQGRLSNQLRAVLPQSRTVGLPQHQARKITKTDNTRVERVDADLFFRVCVFGVCVCVCVMCKPKLQGYATHTPHTHTHSHQTQCTPVVAVLSLHM